MPLILGEEKKSASVNITLLKILSERKKALGAIIKIMPAAPMRKVNTDI